MWDALTNVVKWTFGVAASLAPSRSLPTPTSSYAEHNSEALWWSPPGKSLSCTPQKRVVGSIPTASAKLAVGSNPPASAARVSVASKTIANKTHPDWRVPISGNQTHGARKRTDFAGVPSVPLISSLSESSATVVESPYEQWKAQQNLLIKAEHLEETNEVTALRSKITCTGLAKKGQAITNLRVSGGFRPSEEQGRHIVKLRPPRGQRIPFIQYKRGDLCTLHADVTGQACGTLESAAVISEAVVHAIGRTDVLVTIDSDQLERVKEKLTENVITLGISTNDTTHDKRSRVLRDIEKSDLSSAALLQFVLRCQYPARIIPLPVPVIPEGLDPGQAAAVSFLLTRSPVAILHGPPGTGKTTTLSALITALIKHSPGRKVLVCTGSNVACDNLLERMLKMPEIPKSWLLRLAPPHKSSPKVHSVLLSSAMQTLPAYSELQAVRRTRMAMETRAAKGLNLPSCGESTDSSDEDESCGNGFGTASLVEKRLSRELRAGVINRARAIFTTCTSATSNHLNGCDFEYVIIDEAAQCLEIDALIAVKRGRKLILAGDHHQLGPTIKNNDIDGTTLMGQLMRNEDRGLSVMLKVQFRSNQHISDWSSKRFYGGQVVAHSSVKNIRVSRELDILTWFETQASLCPELKTVTDSSQLLSNKAPDLRYLEEHSYCNLGEALLTIEYLKKTLLPLDNYIRDIGIISPYKKQVKLLEQLLAETHLLSSNGFGQKILVSTVDGFQGGERDVIILNLVRCNPFKGTGFVKNPNRLNVAVTRARKHLIIFGNWDTFCTTDLFQDLHSHIKQNGKILRCEQSFQVAQWRASYNVLLTRLNLQTIHNAGRVKDKGGLGHFPRSNTGRGRGGPQPKVSSKHRRQQPIYMGE